MSSAKSAVPPSPELAQEQRIDHWCLVFENAWLANETPDLTEFLRRVEAEDRLPLLRELLPLDVLYRHRQGEKPTAADYAQLDPALQSIVSEFFEAREGVSPRVGDAIGRFELLELLGRGGFGEVYRACDRDLGRQVAIKTPRMDQTWSIDLAVAFLDEARIAARLSHPRLAPVYDVGRLPGGGCYLVMPLLDGQSLHDRYAGRAMAAADAAQTVRLAAEAVGAIHQAGLVHRDLSPRNILLDNQDGPMIIDFGLAMFLRDARKRAGEMAGSHRYMAPEQLQAEPAPLDPRADVWALGAILFELLYGAPPFADDDPEQLTQKILNAEPARPAHGPSPPAGLRAICGRCLRKDPRERYADAQQLANALGQWSASRRARRQFLYAAGAVLGGSAASALALWRFRHPLPTAAPPLQLHLLVHRQHWRTATPATPLQLTNQDQLRIHAAAAQPLYLYLLWREASGNVQPIYPFQQGAWKLPSPQRKSAEILLPSEDPREVWPMQVAGAGYEVVWLLGARRPLPESALDQLQEILTRPLPPVALEGAWVARFSNGLPQFDRGPLAVGVQRVADQFVQSQRAIADELSRWFDQIESLCIPVVEPR